MNAKRLFEDDDDLFADPSEADSRPSHIELRVDRTEDEVTTQREIPVADDYLLRVPRLAVSEEFVTNLPLDHREGFLLSEIDGSSTIEDILDVCPMPADEALEILESFVARGILVIE
jgi:hypothetical protein